MLSYFEKKRNKVGNCAFTSIKFCNVLTIYYCFPPVVDGSVGDLISCDNSHMQV